MAFDLTKLVPIGQQAKRGSSLQMFTYKSLTDYSNDVQAAGYFDNGYTLNTGARSLFSVGDIIVCDLSDGVIQLRVATNASGIITTKMALPLAYPYPGVAEHPTGFTFDFKNNFPFQVWRTADGAIRHNVDVKKFINPALFTDAAVMYLRTDGSDSNDGSTWALAKATLAGAITAINSNAVPTRLIVEQGIYYPSTTATTVPTQPIAIICEHGKAIFSASVSGGVGSFTLSAACVNTYQNSEASIARIYDTKNLTPDGYFTPLDYQPLVTDLAGTLAAIEAGTWPRGVFYNAGGVIYVRRSDNLEPDDTNILVLKSGNSGLIKMTTSGDMYVEGIETWGAGSTTDTGSWLIGGNASGKFAAKNCASLYAGVNGATQVAINAIDVNDVALCALQNVDFSCATKDGCNSHLTSGTSPVTVAVNCRSAHNGRGASTSNNGLTLHDGLVGIDIAGEYYDNAGANVGCIDANTMLWCVGTVAYESQGDVALGGSQSPLNFWMRSGKMWLDGCVGYGSTNNLNGELLSSDQGTIYTRNCSLIEGALLGTIEGY